VKSLNVQSVPAAADYAVTTPKKQRPMLSSRHTDDDLKSGCYEYITDDSEALRIFAVLLCLSFLVLLCAECNTVNDV